WLQLIARPAVPEGVVVDPDVVRVAQRDGIVKRIPRALSAICRRPLRKAVVRIFERQIPDDDVAATVRHVRCAANVEPDTAEGRMLAKTDDRGVGPHANTDTRLLSVA